MPKTEKVRKGPSESATKFSVGFIKKGNDGNMWKIIATESGIHRWSKMQSASSVKTKQNTTPTKFMLSTFYFQLRKKLLML